MKTLELLEKPKDRGGSIASSRLDYQKDWSLCHLLEVYESGDDFEFIFEHDDDLMVLRKTNNGENFSFHQVKTKDNGEWSLKDLLRSIKRKKGKSLSYLGRLYANKLKYKSKTSSLNFVSNAHYKVKLQNNEDSKKKKKVCVNDLAEAELKIVKEKLKLEHSLTSLPDVDLINLCVAGLMLEDSRVHTMGKLADSIYKFNKEAHFNPTLAYRVIFEEVRRRCNYSEECKTFNDLKKHKSISKKDFLEMLNVVVSSKTSETANENWAITQQKLIQENFDLRDIQKIKLAWIGLEVEAMSPDNTVFEKFISNLKKIVDAILGKYKKIDSFRKFYDETLAEYMSSDFYILHSEVYNEFQVFAVALKIYYEEQKFSETGKKFSK